MSNEEEKRKKKKLAWTLWSKIWSIESWACRIVIGKLIFSSNISSSTTSKWTLELNLLLCISYILCNIQHASKIICNFYNFTSVLHWKKFQSPFKRLKAFWAFCSTLTIYFFLLKACWIQVRLCSIYYNKNQCSNGYPSRPSTHILC